MENNNSPAMDDALDAYIVSTGVNYQSKVVELRDAAKMAIADGVSFDLIESYFDRNLSEEDYQLLGDFYHGHIISETL